MYYHQSDYHQSDVVCGVITARDTFCKLPKSLCFYHQTVNQGGTIQLVDSSWVKKKQHKSFDTHGREICGAPTTGHAQQGDPPDTY